MFSFFPSLPWRFLAGCACGLALMGTYHTYTMRGIELENVNRAYRDQLNAWVAQKNVAAIDERYTRELSDAKETIDRLAGDVRDGKRRLSISAKCLPDARGSGVGYAGRAELSAEAGSAYFDLRRLLELKERQLRALQDYIRTMKNGAPN